MHSGVPKYSRTDNHLCINQISKAWAHAMWKDGIELGPLEKFMPQADLGVVAEKFGPLMDLGAAAKLGPPVDFGGADKLGGR